MATIIVLLVIFSIHATLQQPVNSEITLQESNEVTFKTLCSRSCQDPEHKNVSQGVPLYTCSCSASCATYRDCCYDSPYRHKTTWKGIKSICASVSSRGQFRIISGCPADKLSYFCHANIGHQPPVTSRKTNTSYANIFCATCNGDGDNVVTWNVELKCFPETDGILATVNRTTVLIYHSNYLWRLSQSTGTQNLCTYHAYFDDFELIDGLELRPCHGERKISDCSPSWRDEEIIKLCRSYEDPVYFDTKLFRNSHCAQCNYMALTFARCIPFFEELSTKKNSVDLSLAQFCEKRGSKACMDYLSVVGKGRQYPFSKLLNIMEVACVPNPGKRCCSGEKYDFRSKRCRQFSQRE